MKQSRPAVTWTLRVLRVGLCLFAIWYLYEHVAWYDKIALGDGTRVTLVRDNGATVEVRRNGEVETLPESAVDRQAEGTVNGVSLGVRNAVAGADLRLLGVALILWAPVAFMAAVRLVWMLSIQSVHLTVWQSTKLTFAGNFFNFALPGTTGGDLIKAYYITHYTEHKTEAITTVFLDRVIGLLGVMIVATVVFMVAFGPDQAAVLGPEYTRSLRLIFAVVWGGLATGCLFVFSARLRRVIGLPTLARMMPAGEQLLRIGRATVAMRKHVGLLLASLGLSVLLQGLVIWSAFALARALDMRGDATHYFIFVPIGFLLAAVPITPPQGFGVIEAAYVAFFAKTGLSSEAQALTLALGIRVVQLFWAIPGVLVPLLGAHVPSKQELEELEEPGDEPESPAEPHAAAPTAGR